MRTGIYQANFCAECGNRRDVGRWWQHRYFCVECAARKGKRRYFYFALLACVIGSAVLGWTLSNRRETTLAHLAPLSSATPSTPLTVSAQDAAVQLKPTPVIRSEVYVICGARTKRGTPCKHRVSPGQRCSQHKGQPSMIPEAISQSEGKLSSKIP